jgi:hypothetical protein
VTWTDRILGKTEMMSVPLATTWYASGINMAFGEDTIRRLCPARLCSPEERPEERTGFRHPELLAWVSEERPRLVAAALTILRSYCAAGRPDMRLRPWGSYEAWSAIVRNALAWVGELDPGEAREELASSADTTKNALASLLVGWRELFGDVGGSIAEALAVIERDKRETIPRHARLTAAVAELVPTPAGKPTSALSLAKRMQRARKRVIGGLALDHREGVSGTGTVMWVVRQVTGVPGVTGVVSPPTRGEIDPHNDQKNPSYPSPEQLPLRPRRPRSQATRRDS